jgi:hypothetical protein
MKTIYIIQDWMGNRMFPNKDFKTFEEGWNYIHENVDNSLFEATQNDNDDNYQEYNVIFAKRENKSKDKEIKGYIISQTVDLAYQNRGNNIKINI